METLDEEEAFLEQQQLVGFGFHEIDEDILQRASHRLSAMLPKKLRFSESWALKKVQLRSNGAGRDNATFRAGTTAGPAESGPLKVYVRLRPSSVKGVGVAADKMEEAIKATSDVGLLLEPPANTKRILKPIPTEQFTFTKVFPGQTPQELYFQMTTEPLVEDMLSFRWKNSVVVAYGSSGAGKTHTIEGPQEDPGLLPRAVHAIFQSLEQQQQEQQAHLQRRVLVSFYEVYNDLVYDLLSGIASPVAPIPATGHLHQSQPQPHHHPQSYQHLHLHQHQQQRLMGAAGGTSKATSSSSSQGLAGAARNVLRVREDGSGSVCIPGLAKVPCSRASEALDLHKRAAKLRQQACTGVNSTSSRSHCIFTVKLEEVACNGSTAPSAGRSSQLSFVDLAGSERAKRTNNTGNRLKESLAINGSLMVLGRCLEALKYNQTAAPGAPQRVIPFRESKITHLFKDVLHGWGHLVLSVCVSPVAGDFDETAHVLRYAALATNINMASGPAAAPVQASTSLAPGAAPEEVASSGPASASLTGGTARVAELETELARVYEQLQEAEAHLVQAEASIRDEVVQEIQDVILELRGSYEERMKDLTDQLTQREARIQDLEQQLAAAVASQHHHNHHHCHHFQEGAAQQGYHFQEGSVQGFQEGRARLPRGQCKTSKGAVQDFPEGAVQQKQDIQPPEHIEQREVQEQQQQQQQQHQQHNDAQENREQHPHGASREGRGKQENESTLNKQGGRSRRATRGMLRSLGEGHVLHDATNDAEVHMCTGAFERKEELKRQCNDAEVGTSGAAGHPHLEGSKARAMEAVARGGRKRVSKRHAAGLEAAEEGDEASQPSSSHTRGRKRRATSATTQAVPQVQEDGGGKEGRTDSNAGAQQPAKRSRKSRASTTKGEQGGGKGSAVLFAPIEEAQGEEEAEGLDELEPALAEGPATLQQTSRQRRQTVRL